MKYSKLITKTQKITKEYDSTNAALLIKAGFVDQTMAGVYTFLPLGLRVLNKIEAIVRAQMDTIAAELLMPSLSPKALWETTGRLETIDVLFKALGANKNSQARNDSEYVLNCTHEDIITPIAQKFRTSYKDFPFAVYQIQTKFRNEARPKSGIMRGREFRMKDLYSFHTSQDDFQTYYDAAKEVYAATFTALGLGSDTVLTLASGGDFTSDYSHEFQTRCDAGEDIVFHDAVHNVYYNREVAPSQAPAVLQDSEQLPLQEVFGEHITGMDALVAFLKVPAEKCVKTMLYQADDQVVAVAVRGNYDVNEDKVKKILSCKKLRLATAAVVEQTTGAMIGYAGLVNLPETVRLIADESLEKMINFECGGNKDNIHLINVNWGRDLKKPDQFYDIKVAQPGDLNPADGSIMEYFRAAEVGNIFPLQSRFPEAFGYRYIDTQGKEQPIFMGSYGIGTSRVMGVLVEKFHDENGIIWPEQVAPFQVHLISLRGGEDKAAALYETLRKVGREVLWDDRDLSPGSKFADADLIGCPIRLVISEKTGELVEWKARKEPESKLMTVTEVLTTLASV